MVARRRNDSAWRSEVMATYGPVCVGCGATYGVQADHIVPRSQGGASVVENGLPLCGPFGNTGKDCHGRKTARVMVIEYDWLTPEQVAWLAEVGWVAWDDDGRPHGRGWKHFGDRRARHSHEG